LNAEANFLQTSQKPNVRTSYVFVDDKKRDRTFLLDTGANRNMVDASVLSRKEQSAIDKTVRVSVANIQQGKGTLKSMGELELQVPHKNEYIKLKFIVMPPHSINYNLIGVIDMMRHFLPLFQELSIKRELDSKVEKFQAEVNQVQAETKTEETPPEVLTEEEATQYLEMLPTLRCPPEPQQKDVVDQEWFAKLWNLFPRLQMEKQNLQDDSRLPYKCKVELVEGARMFFAPQYQLSEKSAGEMARFLKDAEDKGIIEKGETICQSSAFMVARADPNAPQRMVVDFRTLNNETVPKDASLPRTGQLPNYASRGGIMSKLDLTKGFYHVDVDMDSRPILGIVTEPGGYRFRKLPMGWIN